MVANTVASTQLVAAWKSGETPRSMAPRSFSAAARVASPKRVKRNSAQRAAAAATAAPAMMRRSTGKRVPPSVNAVPVGQELRDRQGLRAVAVRHDRLQREHETDRRHNLRECRHVTKGTKDEEVDDQSEDYCRDQRDPDARPRGEARVRADVEEPRHAGHRHIGPAEVAQLNGKRQEIPAGRTETDVHIGGVHPQCTLGEVDDAGAAVSEDDAERDVADDGSGPEPENAPEQIVDDGSSPWLRTDRCVCSSPVA